MATRKMLQFVDEYLANGFNGKEAAISAGYSPNGAAQKADWLLRHKELKPILDQKLKAIQKKNEMSTEDVFRELVTIARANISDYSEWTEKGIRVKNSDELTPDQLKAISEIVEKDKDGNIKIKLYDKLRALELLGKIYAMFTENKNITGNMSWTLEGEDDSEHKNDF